MNRSSFGDKTSGFSNSNDGNQNFSFNAPSVPRSGGSLSKPRMLKVRRHMNSLGLRSSSIPDTQFGPGFNPFIADRSIPSSFVPPKVSASDDLRFNKIGNDEFLLRENRNDPSLVSNSNSATTSLRGVIEEVKNLNIGSMNAKDTSIADETIGSKLPEDMKKLNIKDTGIGENSVKNKDMMFNLSAHNKTMIGVETEDNVGSSFGTHAIHRLPNELKKLNIKDTEQIRSGNGISGADNTNKFEIGSGKVADIGILRNSIPEKMKNLNIKDTEQIRSGNGISGADNTNKFEIGSGKVADIGILRNSIPEKMKNLNIENASTIESIEKNKANASSLKDMSFVESTTSSSNHISSSKNSLLLKKMEELKLGVKVEGSTKNIKSDSGIDCHQAAFTGYNSPAVRQEKDERNSQVASHQQTDSNNRNMTADEMPPMNRPEIATDKQDSFGVPFVFQTPNRKEFSATNHLSKNRSGKFKPPAIVQLWSDQDYVTVENSFQENREASDSYSPMDVSPYQEILADGQCTREILMTSEESFNHDPEVTSSVPVGTADDVDEDLLRATVRLDINEGHMINRGTIDAAEEDTGFCFSTIDGIKVLCEESVSGVETESFKSATEEIDFSSEVTSSPADTESCSTSNLERRDSDVGMHYYSESNPEDVAKSNFIFSASHGAQGQLSTTKSQYKKKNKAKGSHDIDIPSPNSNKVSFTSSSQFLSLSGNSPLLSPGRSKKELSFVPYNCGDEASMPKVQDTKIEFVSTSAATIAAQEVCEKWRLRGNSAYSNGDLSNAEDYYSKGVNCLSVNETSRSCRRALMLCYSNRAATRMSLGRMRDAISDCIMASSIDPSFLKVQLRAANCYLSLGEVEDATRYFKRCLQSGSECVDRKIVVEASEGLQRTARVSHCINQSAELLQTRVPNNAESALELIVEALVLSPCSEKLLEMKADALYTLRRLEEVIQVCEQTIDSAEANSPPVNDGNLVTNLGASEILKRFYFRVWRCHLILKSYFHLGRLEEGLALLEKQEEKVFEVTRYGSKILESSIPLAATVRELLRCKTAGNEAFQEGRHSDAVEHYTTAISCNVESRPFAAVCFCNRAAAYKALGQVLDAIADCSLAIALDTEYLKAISRRASLYEMIRDYGQAARDLQVLVSLFAKQLEEKIKQSGTSDRSMNVSNDLKQARLRLLEIEEEDRKELPLDMYLILGIDASVSAAEIKKAYRKAALRHHPDKAGQSLARTEFGDEGLWKDRAAEVHKDADILFKIIGEAYAVLSDPIKRSRYDAEEEMRNTQKKRTGSSTSRRNTDFQSHQFEKSGNMRHWREVWRSYGNSTPGMSEVPRSSRY